jgi:acetyl-CoA carboxylase biotin carboxyl carrier protein
MFKFEEICELIQLVGSSGVASVEVEHAGSRVRIEGRTQVVAVQAAPSVAAAAAVPEPVPEAPEVHGSAAPERGPAVPEEENLHPVNSPIVGTFYRAPNPDADPYVKVGDFVEQGQTLCIVEAMKLMNEIEADIRGTVVKVLPENAQPVEYGESLFMVRPA